ncbi:FUSC family protein [Streptomyces thermolineatus]|uniref:FUSC family protein n=1 Tax=Streptomyces thermolineatus TaxID=44033 RepID=A0ABP5Z9H6_9ACTN
MAVAWRTRSDVWDRFTASDPGLIRLAAAVRTVAAVLLALAVLAAAGIPVPMLVTGGTAAMASTATISEARPKDQAVTLALALPTALAAVVLAAYLGSWPLTAAAVFLALIFAAVYVRRYGERGKALGMIGFQLFFITLFVGTKPQELPGTCAVVAAAFACSAVARFLLVRAEPEATLGRLRDAFRARLAQVVAAQTALVDSAAASSSAGPDADRAVEELRKQTARLHECALMIQTRLEDGTREPRTAALLQRRVAEAEIAAERLGVLILKARHHEGVDTLTLHLPESLLPGELLPSGPAAPAPVVPEGGETEARLRRDLRALHLLVGRTATQDRGTALTHLRNRLIAYRDDENLPPASPAVQDVFRAIGELTRAVLGLRMALDGPQDESDDTLETMRSREELEAEDASIAASDEETPEPEGLERPTTRLAFQVTVGSALAIVGGELLSEQRWYWAVLTCWVVFLNTTSTGEILVKGYRRLLGTVAGVVAGAWLAGVVGERPWLAFALVVLCVFGMFFTAPLSYALMSFFVTAMLGLLYTLLNTYSTDVLVLRIEETAVGAACGLVAALFVLPVRTASHTDEQLREVLQRLREVTEASVAQLGGTPAPDLLDRARELDTALDALRQSAGPLTHPASPLRGRRRTVRYIVALLEMCAYHARSLAATAELLPYSKRIAADPRLVQAGERIDHNLQALVARLEPAPGDGAGRGGAVHSGSSVAAMLETAPGPGGAGAGPLEPGTVAYRVLRHLQRLDEGVVGLARPLGAPVDDGRGTV